MIENLVVVSAAPESRQVGEDRGGEILRLKKMLSFVLVIGLCGGLALTSNAGAGTLPADTTVTIKAQSGDFSGKVKSSDPLTCADGRNVTVFKQKGAEQDPKNDKKIASDTAGLQGEDYTWSTGNTGVSGKFYARVKKTPECKGDRSKTVKTSKD